MLTEDQINMVADSYKSKGLAESQKIKALAAILQLLVTKCNIDQGKYHIGGLYTLRECKKQNTLQVYMIGSAWKKLKRLKIGTLPKAEGAAPKYVIKVDELAKDASIEFYLQNKENAPPKFNHGAIKKKMMRDEFGHLCYSLDQFAKLSAMQHKAGDKVNMQLLSECLAEEGAGCAFGLDAEESKKYSKKLAGIVKRW
jgi:hypothetical protein